MAPGPRRQSPTPFSELRPTPSTPNHSMRQHPVCELMRATAYLSHKSAVNCHYQIWAFGKQYLHRKVTERSDAPKRVPIQLRDAQSSAMANMNLNSQSFADARARQRAVTDQKLTKLRALVPRRSGLQMRRGMKPIARMAAAIKRTRAISDLDRCCAIWWLYRLHFGINRDVMLGLPAVARERSRCGI